MNTCKTCYWYSRTTVEDDEGWGMIPGQDFGCIHHKDKE